MYKIKKLHIKNRCTIEPNALVEIEVCESIAVPSSSSFLVTYDNDKTQFNSPYAKFYLRKAFVKSGLLQQVHTPFPTGWKGVPLVVVQNNGVAPIELLTGEEIGELWFFDVDYNDIC